MLNHGLLGESVSHCRLADDATLNVWHARVAALLLSVMLHLHLEGFLLSLLVGSLLHHDHVLILY